MDNQFVKWNNNKWIHIFLSHVYILGISSLLLLGFDLNRVLQHGHVFSSVLKNNAQSEHHFCPILYRILFENVVDLKRPHKPLHICTINSNWFKIYLRKFPSSVGLFYFNYCINFSHGI